MQALKFNLSGKTAIFKRPDVNGNCYFTYSHIHKPALLGIFGAICGFRGYNQQKNHNDKCKNNEILKFPEFYEKLRNIKIAIIPKQATFTTKVQKFNNSVGYASQEVGRNLIVTEQWLENPSWEIFVLLDGTDVTEELKQRFLSKEFVFIPYLGKNDHFANITDVEIVELQTAKSCEKVNSMILAKNIEKTEEDLYSDILEFKYSERLPVALDEEDNQYLFEKFVFTNMNLSLNNPDEIYTYESKNIAFF